MRGIERHPGDDVGGYRVLRALGRGGSGAVYLVADEGGAEAALKLVDTADAGARLRLSREVAALQSLRHPSVPRVLDAELDDEDAFVVFEFIDGPSLSQFVARQGALAPGQVAELADVLAGALTAVHAAGVVHRDVTPSNVLLGSGGPMLIDFGISHHAEDDRLTRTGLVSGTAGYVAPEVIDGGEPTAASDNWALAATLAFAATGRAPFGTGMGALSATLAGEVRPDVPLALARALTAAPQFRPQPRELARMLAEGDQTAVLGVGEVEPTLVAPVGWEDEAAFGYFDRADRNAEGGDLHEYEHEDAEFADDELPERVLPHRRGLLLTAGVALVALATVAPMIAAALALVATVVARGVESAARAVWRSRDRRGVEQGGIVAQALASPWHLGRALVLTLPSAALAALAVYALGYGGHALAMSAETAAAYVLMSFVVPAVAGLALLGWGPRGREARIGAHIVAAGLAPSRGWALFWGAVFITAAIALLGIAFAGIDQVWWPLGKYGPY
ncbi:protein kinase domain-containing protein [Demequina sp.]|uniref:protein kinase domain-containing protein n=1 Tax=Demequina sp. TaxID=2050685 RepID=UPI003D0FE285